MSTYTKLPAYVNLQTAMQSDVFDEFTRFCDIVLQLKKNVKSNKTQYEKVIRQTKRHINGRFGKVANQTAINYMNTVFSSILEVDLDGVELSNAITTIPITTSSNIKINDSDEDTKEIPVVAPEPIKTKENTNGGLCTNAIICKSLSILLCRVGDKYYLPGGFAEFNESGRNAIVRYLKEQCNITGISGSDFDMLSSYESNETNPSERHVIANFLYSNKTRQYATGTNKYNPGYVDFDKVLSLNLFEEDAKIIKQFVLK